MKIVNLGSLRTLKSTTDQTVEATHSKLDNFLKQHGYFRNNLDDTATGEKLFDGILAWNSYVVGDVK